MTRSITPACSGKAGKAGGDRWRGGRVGGSDGRGGGGSGGGGDDDPQAWWDDEAAGAHHVRGDTSLDDG